MKNQAFFSSKDKSKKLKCRLLQFLLAFKNEAKQQLKLFKILMALKLMLPK